MAATWIDGGYVNGTAEYTYSAGLVWGLLVSCFLRIGGGEPLLGMPPLLPYDRKWSGFVSFSSSGSSFRLRGHCRHFSPDSARMPSAVLGTYALRLKGWTAQSLTAQSSIGGHSLA